MSGSTWYMINAADAIVNLVFVDDADSTFGGDPETTPISLIDDTETGYYPMMATVLTSTNQDPPIFTNPSYPYILFKQKANNMVAITDYNMTNLPFSTVCLDFNAQLENYQFAGTDLDIGPNESNTFYYILALGDSNVFKW